MKYLKEELDIKGGIKKFKNWYKFRDIHNICKEYRIKNYHINDDGTVDVDGNIFLTGSNSKKLNKIPLNFGEISGYFHCEWNNLSDLIGSPKRVGGDFICNWNDLTSLEGCPVYIGGIFQCTYNPNLWSFDYFPRHAKGVNLYGIPICNVFNLFRTVYLEDGGRFFSTSGTMMDFFWDCDPVYPGKVIKKRRMDNFLASIEKKLRPEDIEALEKFGWEIED